MKIYLRDDNPALCVGVSALSVMTGRNIEQSNLLKLTASLKSNTTGFDSVQQKIFRCFQKKQSVQIYGTGCP